MFGFLIIVTRGKYLSSARSTSSVKLPPSTTACARAWVNNSGFKKRVRRCLLLVDIVHILQLIDILHKGTDVFMSTTLAFLRYDQAKS